MFIPPEDIYNLNYRIDYEDSIVFTYDEDLGVFLYCDDEVQ